MGYNDFCLTTQRYVIMHFNKIENNQNNNNSINIYSYLFNNSVTSRSQPNWSLIIYANANLI